MQFDEIAFNICSSIVNYPCCSCYLTRKEICDSFLKWEKLSFSRLPYFQLSLNLLKWKDRIPASRPLNKSICKCKAVFPKTYREKKCEKLLRVLKDACPMDILKISQFKHLKHETTSAWVVIKLRWKNNRKRHCCYSGGSITFSKQNTYSFYLLPSGHLLNALCLPSW